MEIKKGKKFGFTLAEVLVTLGIIGVVSALTLPSLTQNWQKRSYVTQLHKVYSEIQQGFVSRIDQRSAVNLIEAGLISNDEGQTFLRNQFKVVKDCGNSTTPCFASSYKNLNGNPFTASGYVGNSIINGSGVAIKMSVSTGVSSDDANTKMLGIIFVDINGPKGPNILGRDLFEMYFYPDGSLDSYGVPISCRTEGKNCGKNNPRDTRDEYYKSCKSASADDNGGCFGKILNDNWEMKY